MLAVLVVVAVMIAIALAVVIEVLNERAQVKRMVTLVTARPRRYRP